MCYIKYRIISYIQNFGFLSDQNFHFFASKKWIAIFRLYKEVYPEEADSDYDKALPIFVPAFPSDD